MTVPIHRLDVPLADIEAHMARQKLIAFLWVARVQSDEPSDQIAYALDAWLVEHPEAPIATDADYPAWAAALAASPTYFRAKEAAS
ncbi:hypothetical protein [Streptomyces sp.]|uniref:hypothetical protein n=1 Tax=Streptomyces sp. TaxID=1931 RepID=UPI002F9382F1